ncbi:MAG: NAD(P)-binding domain-containing protein [Pelagimonas sp.]|nr:NAD(P)-binding domain-containing protein [Pelagimonas sp.]
MKIGVLGTGTIASAVVRGIARDGHDILVSERSADNAMRLAATYDCVRIETNQAIADRSDLLLIGLMAEHARHILPELQLRSDQRVISFMAGIDLQELSTLIAPATASAIVMPFPGIAQGDSPVMALGDKDLVCDLLGTRNRIYMMQNAQELDAYLCAQAVLSVAARQVEQAGRWLSQRVVDADQGDAFLRDLIGSSLLAAPNSADLIEALNTPGGYNQRLRIYMEESGMTDALHAGLSDLEKPA